VSHESAIPRRTFLTRTAALGAATGAVLLVPGLQNAAHGADIPLDQLEAATFAPLVGKVFPFRALQFTTPLFDMTLLSVTNLTPPRAGTPGLRPKPFSLVFRGPTAKKQQIYRVENAQLGTFVVFVAPVNTPSLGHYEVVFA
jgi:hypothetical protein